MRSADIVEQLGAIIPLYTDAFSDSVAIDTIVPVGSVATATTAAAHGILEGQDVAIVGAEAPAQIDTGSFLRTGSQAIFQTLQDHDFTLSETDKAGGGKTLTISGATEAEFNGTFSIISVPSRTKLVIAVDDSGSTTISGSPIVDNANGNIFNGYVNATNVTANTFDYELPVSYPIPATGFPSVAKSIRIIAVLDIVQYLNDIYTKQAVGDNHLVVQLGDVSASKNRDEPTDSVNSRAGNNVTADSLIQPFSVYIVINSTQSLAAAELRDEVETVYVPAIFRSLANHAFDSGFRNSQFKTTFVGHGVLAYSDEDGKNKALYVHEVTFEQVAKIYSSDTVGQGSTVAMRDIDFTITGDLGTNVDVMTASINLDEEQ